MVLTDLICLHCVHLRSQADAIYLNGNIYTVDQTHPRAQAIAVKERRIVYVGTTKGARAFQGGATHIVDLHGATVVPGLTDAHYHLGGVGEREQNFNLEGTNSLSELQQRIAARVRQSKPGSWIVGSGWIETTWKPPVFPSKSDLDWVSPNNPVFIYRSDGHSGIGNSLALQKAGITKSTPNPSGGQFVKDGSGELTGMVVDNALGQMNSHLPEESDDEKRRALILGVKRSLKLGWCEVQIPGNSWRESEMIRGMVEDQTIKLRIYDAIGYYDAQQILQRGPEIGAFDGHFTRRGIKFWADGSMGSKSAALLEPYNGEKSSGFMTLQESAAMPVFIQALKKGVQIETHAIGDLANRKVLNWYERAFHEVPGKSRSVKQPRWRIEHAQLVTDADVTRFVKLGVIPSMQPSHAIGDLHFAERRIGFDRLAEGYRWQDFIRSGAIVPGGSDAPVERGEPMIEFYAAVYRHDLKGFAGRGWHLEQAVSRENALKMFTLWPAYAAFEEQTKGSLAVGKLADMTVLSADIMRIPPQQILNTTCLLTVIDGQIVFDGR